MPSLLALCLAVLPVLQPGVKEYAERPESFPVGTLPVFHQDLVQCRIGAAEVRAGAPQVWRGKEPTAAGVYIAFADKVAYVQFLHDGSEVRLGKNGLELPPDKPNVEIPVVEVFPRLF